MTVQQLIQYLRSSMMISDPNIGEDSAYLSLTDEELLLYLNVTLGRYYPQVRSVDSIPNNLIYPVTLLTKKDLFYTLATSTAPLFDLGADNNNYLKRSQRFDHYLKLIAQVEDEYQNYLENGGEGGNVITTHNVILPTRYNTRYNYENGIIPTPIITVDQIGEDYADISWEVHLSKFFRYKVYLSESPIVMLDGFNTKISSEADLLYTIQDVHKKQCRISGLDKNKTYHVAVSASEMSSLIGYDEVTIEIKDTEEPGGA